ncbi:hypothetical protein SAMN04488564_11339 [Lentzea waywayandensis]|uniref:Uncharacterized protein n=1 Tax=Lentzea waywayandensis TaxID=84724 RepID=A0A1I6FDY1_9PSEU|nr:hypothetical protein [Lentzea waywayandensis]SFR28191.1 hypothetical protein SAMN04488564_11339 [Lentzea waywayandensis]
MTGDDDEAGQAERTVNIISGTVFGTVVQLGSVNGNVVFPEPKASAD